jgi:ribosomal protein S18 acetylase RimI-like enzyme
MSVRLRLASTDDLSGILDVFLLCWQVSYAAVLPPRLVETMTAERGRLLWQGALESDNAGQVLIATRENDPEILGVTRFGSSERVGDVHSLYVHPRSQGLGIGGRLLTAATDVLAAQGGTRARLWVFEQNAPSVHFYARHGWLPDGESRVQEEFGEREIRLSKPLESLAGAQQ